MKLGLDDFFAAGNDVAALLALLAPELRDISPDTNDARAPYCVEGGRMCFRKPTKEGPVLVPLCNFEAWIEREILRDDGAERQVHLEIAGRRKDGTILPSAGVQAERFPGMGWVVSTWGVGAVISAGFTLKDRLREAIQVLSPSVERRQVFTHAGWRKIDDDWLYLHARGAIGKDGTRQDIYVELEGPLGKFQLPDPPRGEELQAAISASLDLLDLGPDAVTVPGLAAVSRAPLCEPLAADFSVYYAGHTGVFKSEVAALLQGHFGNSFRREDLPGNWSSTANSLERQAFLAKDAIFVVDDFAPSGSRYDVARTHKEAERLLRAAGNQAGRGRLRPDGSSRPSYSPRGIIVSTGEDIPRGQSIRARLLIIEISQGDIDTEELTRAQQARDEGLLARAMSGYLQWLAPQIDALQQTLPTLKTELRGMATASEQHRRTPDLIANLAIGMKLFLRFAVECEAISEKEKQTLWDRSWSALGEAGATQDRLQQHEDPVDRFIALLVAALSSGRAHVVDAEDGGKPEQAELWGWREEVLPVSGSRWREHGDRIGWLGGDDLYLEPEASFSVIQKLAASQGTSLSIASRTLWKRLNERGLLASHEAGKNLARVTVVGNRRGVAHINKNSLSYTSEMGPIGPHPSSDAGLSAVKLAPKSGKEEKQGQIIGPGPGSEASTSFSVPDSKQQSLFDDHPELPLHRPLRAPDKSPDPTRDHDEGFLV